MVKEKKKHKLGIKTTRYFTKKCTKCDFEYPSWFTNCPKCGASWNSMNELTSQVDELTLKKNIKIVVKITEEQLYESINKVQLFFSTDSGVSWYQMSMDFKQDYYLAEITEVPINIAIIYYMEVYLASGEKIIENNSGKFFYYKVGGPSEEIKDMPPKKEKKIIRKNVNEMNKNLQDKDLNRFESTISNKTATHNVNKELSSQIPEKLENQDLKYCLYCNSKIKKIWSICPICGNKT